MRTLALVSFHCARVLLPQADRIGAGIHVILRSITARETQMVEHIVLFKWREDAPPGDIAKAVHALKELKDQIPGIVSLTVGDNFSNRSQGFQCGLVVRFEDRRALEESGTRPAAPTRYVHQLLRLKTFPAR